MGKDALFTNNGSYNVGIGENSLSSNSSGSNNVSVGRRALFSNTTASDNSALGFHALYSNTTGHSNVAMGYAALSVNSTGIRNVAIGMNALDANTTSNDSVAVGWGSLTSNTGAENTAVGTTSLESNTSGTGNVAMGYNALSSNTTANNNTAVGYKAMTTSTTASDSTVFGFESLHDLTTGADNAAFGYKSGHSLTTGSFNTFLGDNAGFSMTTGSKNTIIGRYTGNSGGLDIRTADNNIVLSDGDANPRLRIDSSGRIQTSQAYGNNSDGTFNITENLGARACISLRSNASGNTGNFVLFTSDNGSNAGEITHTGATSISYAATSDYRLKNNVTYTFDATTRLKQLKPARFSWNHDDTNTLIDGFLAHEVQTVVPEAVNRAKDAVKVWKDGEELPDGVSVGDNKLDEDGNTIPDYQTMDMSKMIPLLVKTIQELEARIVALENG
jgi:hypothetical protein